MRRTSSCLGCLLALAVPAGPASAEKAKVEYRVVYAHAKDLARPLEAAGRDGFACVGVARPDLGAAPEGVAVILGRPAGTSASPVANRAIVSGWGKDVQEALERAGGEGFRLCGVVLDEGGPNRPLVYVLSKRGDSPAAHYVVEVLKIWKESLARLKDRAAEGFRLVAASSIDDNRVPDMRSWLVVAEKTDSAPREIAVRSSARGSEDLQKALNESGAQGYRVDLVWKDGNDAVAMLSRPKDGAKNASFVVESSALDKIHWVKGLYLADVAHRGEDRLVVSESGISASADVEDDPLPALPRYGSPAAEALEVLGNHLGRHPGFAPVSSRIRRAPGGGFALTTVLVSRGS